MKLNTTLPVVLWGMLSLSMASIIPSVSIAEQVQRDDATPTRPELVDRIPRPSEIARGAAGTAATAAVGRVLEQEAEDDIIRQQGKGEQQQQNWHQFLKRRQAEEEIERRLEPSTRLSNSSVMSPTSTVPVTVISSPGAAGVTAVAVFTANGGIYSVTSASGMVVVDGKTLSMGSGGQLIGGEEVSEVSAGLVANGQTIAFTPLSTSAVGSGTGALPSMSISMPGPVVGASTSSAASGMSASSAAASSTSSAGAVPGVVAAGGSVNAVAALGALFGWMLL